MNLARKGDSQRQGLWLRIRGTLEQSQQPHPPS
jgi:hypothetical protein